MEYLLEKFDPNKEAITTSQLYKEQKQQFILEVQQFDTSRFKDKNPTSYTPQEIYDIKLEESQRQQIICTLIQKQHNQNIIKNYEARRKKEYDNSKNMDIGDIRDKKTLLNLHQDKDLEKYDQLDQQENKNDDNTEYYTNEKQEKNKLIQQVKQQARKVSFHTIETQYEIPQEYFMALRQQELNQENQQLLIEENLKRALIELRNIKQNTEDVFYATTELDTKYKNLNQENFKLDTQQQKQIKEQNMNIKFKKIELDKKLGQETKEKFIRKSLILKQETIPQIIQDKQIIKQLDDDNRELQQKIDNLLQKFKELVQDKFTYLFKNNKKLQQNQNYQNCVNLIKVFMSKNNLTINNQEDESNSNSSQNSIKQQFIKIQNIEEKQIQKAESQKNKDLLMEQYYKNKNKKQQQSKSQNNIQFTLKNKSSQKKIEIIQDNLLKNIKNFKVNLNQNNYHVKKNFEQKSGNFLKLMSKIRLYQSQKYIIKDINQIDDKIQMELFFQDWSILEFLQLKNINPDLRKQFIIHGNRFYKSILETYFKDEMVNQLYQKNKQSEQKQKRQGIETSIKKKEEIDTIQKDFKIIIDTFKNENKNDNKSKNKIPLKMNNCIERLPVLRYNILNIL